MHKTGVNNCFLDSRKLFNFWGSAPDPRFRGLCPPSRSPNALLLDSAQDFHLQIAWPCSRTAWDIKCGLSCCTSWAPRQTNKTWSAYRTLELAVNYDRLSKETIVYFSECLKLATELKLTVNYKEVRWNSFSANVHSCATLLTFRRYLKSHLFQSSFPTA